MKIILVCLLLFSSFFATAQKGGVTADELKKLAGNWSGILTYTDYSNDKSKTSLPTKLEIVDLKDSLRFNYTYTEPSGKLVKNKGSLRYLKEEDQLIIDGDTYYVNAVRRRGVRLTIIADREGTDNDKPAEIRKTITIGPSLLIIIKEVKYSGAKEYFIRNKTELQKK